MQPKSDTDHPLPQAAFTGLDGVCEELVSNRGGLDIVALATMLLSICRRHAIELRGVLDDAAMSQHRVQQRKAAETFFKAVDDEVLEEENLAGLAAFLRESAAASRSQILPVRAAAEGLDAALGPRFAGLFRRKRVQLRPNSACPISHPPLRSILGKLTSEPDTVTTPLDGLRFLRLTPTDLGRFAIVLDGSLEDQLSVLDEEGRVVSAVPSAGLHAYDWDEFDREQHRYFYNVRPKAPDDQLAVLKALLDRAEAAGAGVAVLPELCVTTDIVDALFAYFHESTKALNLVVVGSAHVPTTNNDLGRNRAFAFVRAHRKVLVHDKFTRFEFDGGTEYIQTDQATLTLYTAGGWCFTFLVCKDLLEVPVVQVLASLRVRLALVPALSPKTELFELRAQQLALDGQAIVAIANTPSSDSAAVAIFARPTREIQRMAVFYLKDGEELPRAYMLEIGGEAKPL